MQEAKSNTTPSSTSTVQRRKMEEAKEFQPQVGVF